MRSCRVENRHRLRLELHFVNGGTEPSGPCHWCLSCEREEGYRCATRVAARYPSFTCAVARRCHSSC